MNVSENIHLSNYILYIIYYNYIYLLILIILVNNIEKYNL